MFQISQEIVMTKSFLKTYPSLSAGCNNTDAFLPTFPEKRGKCFKLRALNLEGFFQTLPLSLASAKYFLPEIFTIGCDSIGRGRVGLSTLTRGEILTSCKNNSAKKSNIYIWIFLKFIVQNYGQTSIGAGLESVVIEEISGTLKLKYFWIL